MAVNFPLKKIDGVSSEHLSAIVDDKADLIITRKFVQSVSGSAPMKIAGQVISIFLAYPRAQVVLDMTEATISESQLKVLKSHVEYFNRGGWIRNVPRVKILSGE